MVDIKENLIVKDEKVGFMYEGAEYFEGDILNDACNRKYRICFGEYNNHLPYEEFRQGIGFYLMRYSFHDKWGCGSYLYNGIFDNNGICDIHDIRLTTDYEVAKKENNDKIINEINKLHEKITEKSWAVYKS